MDQYKNKGIIMMIFATFFWGYMGISSRFLNQIHLNSPEIAFIRCLSAAILLSIFLYFKNKAAFKVSLTGFIFCAFYGLITSSIGISLYSFSVKRVPLSVATVLMFSNPIWVTLFNYIFFKEKVGFKKIFLITTCIFGCMCIIDIFSTGGSNLDLIGLIASLLNGMTFALQIILPKFVDGKISKDTILLYGFWSSSLILSFFTDIPGIYTKISSSHNPLFFLANVLSIGVLSTFIANTFYVKSTEYIGTSLPSMMVALEPIFASILAFFIFKENMKFIQVLGAIIVILSVIALEFNFKKKAQSS